MIETTINGIALRFESTPRLFSPQHVDAGTLAMLAAARIEAGDKVLDLGCGYGAVGILAAKIASAASVWMIDNDPEAIACATANAKLNGVADVHIALSDGFRDFSEAGFTGILCNPPYHADFSVAKHFIEKGFNRLVLGGTLWMVTRRDTWYRNKLSAIFGGVRVHKSGVYLVFEAVKKTHSYARARHGS